VRRAAQGRGRCAWHGALKGGESPDPGPGRREPDTEETRALHRTTGAFAKGCKRREACEGRSSGSHRCVTVSNESEAP